MISGAKCLFNVNFFYLTRHVSKSASSDEVIVTEVKNTLKPQNDSLPQIRNGNEPLLSRYSGHDPALLLIHRLTPSSLCWAWITPTWPAWVDWSEWSRSKRYGCDSLSWREIYIYALTRWLYSYTVLRLCCYSYVRPSRAPWRWPEWKYGLLWPVFVTVGTAQTYLR